MILSVEKVEEKDICTKFRFLNIIAEYFELTLEQIF